jgi:hypothetical protein
MQQKHYNDRRFFETGLTYYFYPQQEMDSIFFIISQGPRTLTSLKYARKRHPRQLSVNGIKVNP